jgi:hypothetical protein
LLGAVMTIGNGRHVMCFPGRVGVNVDSASVSVHAQDKNGDLKIDQEVERASDVLLGPESVRRCRRYWRWDSIDRVPYTFPTTSKKQLV